MYHEEFKIASDARLVREIVVYVTGVEAPKPPSDEGGGSPQGETEGEKNVEMTENVRKTKHFSPPVMAFAVTGQIVNQVQRFLPKFQLEFSSQDIF